MKNAITTLLLSFVLTAAWGQKQQRLSLYLLTQYNKTFYDYTKGNNPSSIGLGFEAFFKNKSRFTPTIELTGDVYFEDDKVLRLNADGSQPENGNDVREMVNIFAGSSFLFTRTFYLSFVGGPSFIGRQAFAGIKPSAGFFFSQSHKITLKVSYINVFNRTIIGKEDFGSLSVAIGCKLF